MKKFQKLLQDYVICIIPLWIGNNEISPINLSLTVVFVVLIGIIVFYWLYSNQMVPRSFQVMLESDISLRNCKFINNKRFHVKFEDIFFVDKKVIFKPVIEKNYFYGYRGIWLDCVIVNSTTFNVEDIIDASIIKVYIQFKNFFLIKAKDDNIYFFNNNIFKKDLNEYSDIDPEILEMLKYPEFKIFHESLDMYNLKQYTNYTLNNQGSSLGFEFKDIRYGTELSNLFVKHYRYVCEKNDFNDKNIVDIHIFEDVIIIDDVINNCLSIYKNILTIKEIKNERLFIKALIDMMNLDTRVNTVRIIKDSKI